MSEKFNLYKCEKCGGVVEIVIEGNNSLVCCGSDMKLIEAAKTDGALEKHVPVIEHLGTSHVVKIGIMPHPMTEEHYIQFIEIISKDGRYLKREYLNPNEDAQMIIKCLENNDFSAREYCSIHGLYEGGNDGK